MRTLSPAPDRLGRRSRIRAYSSGKRIQLTDRNLILLQALHRHGPLASSLFLKNSKHLGMNEKRTRERLTDLFHESDTVQGGAYLKRPQQQFQTIDARYNQLVYDLAPAGLRALKDVGEWSETSGPSGGTWWHRFMTSSITASIELSALGRSEVSYIRQSVILDRANASLASPVTYIDPVLKEQVSKQLIPDALFGLEYHTPRGSNYRFFAVEADRATEPIETSNANRKSFLKTMHQYEALIAGNQYRAHYKLTAPLLVLFVSTTEQRVSSMIKVVRECNLAVAPALLFQNWSNFVQPISIPSVNHDLLNAPWQHSAGALSIA